MSKKQEEIRVSIIMGIYNVEKTLDEAIQSILNQTYTGWKMIMCDDASKDDTWKVAKKYVDLYPGKFVLLKNECNKGLNYTLNRCLELVDTEYVARMDGDDISLPTRLEKEITFLDKNEEFALVSSSMGMFDEDGDWGNTSVILEPKKDDLLHSAAVFCHAACMVRANVFIKVKGYTVDKRLLRVEDRHLWFKIYANGYKGANIEEVLYKMRDDRKATNRRTFRNRINACYCQYIGFKLLKAPIYKYFNLLIYVILEIGKVVVPVQLYEFAHKMKYQK